MLLMPVVTHIMAGQAEDFGLFSANCQFGPMANQCCPGAQKLTGDSLRVVRAEFSTLS